MQIHQLKREHPLKKSRQVGRGGKRGKTAGRGTKGQLARSGRKLRPELRDIIKKIPKRRGYGRNRGSTVNDGVVKAKVVQLGSLNKVFAPGATINPAALFEQKLIRRESGKLPKVKILAGGALSKNFQFIDCLVSASARAQIEKAGGKIS